MRILVTRPGEVPPALVSSAQAKELLGWPRPPAWTHPSHRGDATQTSEQSGGYDWPTLPGPRSMCLLPVRSQFPNETGAFSVRGFSR
jgi:hypothetical protein